MAKRAGVAGSAENRVDADNSIDVTETEHTRSAGGDLPTAIAAIIDDLQRVGSRVDDVGDAAQLHDLTRQLRRAERVLAGVLSRVARTSSRLADAGTGPPPEELLRGSGEITTGRARAELERANTAEQFPALGRSLTEGRARPDNLDVLARATDQMTPAEVVAMTDHDEAIADAAEVLPPESFAKRIRRLRDRIRTDHGASAAERVRAETYGRVRLGPDKDRVFLSAMIEPVAGTAIMHAVSAEHRRLVRSGSLDPALRPEQVDAQALTELILRGSNADAGGLDSGRIGVNVNVLVDAETLVAGPHDDTICETSDGVGLPPATLSRLCCDAAVRRVFTAPDGEVHVSRESRTATSAQRAALLALYGGCAITGAPWSQVEIHHVRFHEDGGPTSLDNLVPISRRFHHLIHDRQWRLDMAADRTLTLRRPNGTIDRSIAPPTPILHRRQARRRPSGDGRHRLGDRRGTPAELATMN